MSQTGADYLVDRRRIRRKLTFWRVGAGLAVAALILVAGWRLAGAGSAGAFEHHVARINLQGLITGDRETLKLIEDVSRARNVDAVILSVESPGGTTSGSEAVYDSLRSLADKKPTVTVVRSLAASGAYIAALGTEHIVAGGNSLVGSIGVLFQFPNVSRLLDTVGVKLEEVKSSPLKAAPNGFEQTSPEARAALAALVADSFDWFKGLVKERRHMSDTELASVADGRVFTGRQGLPLKLVDEIGDEKTGIAWLEKTKGVQRDLPIRDWKPSRPSGAFGLFGTSASVADTLGMSTLARVLRSLDVSASSGNLDGLLALWQVQGQN